MKIIDVEKVYQGKYISYYIASYLLNDGSIKKYELVSRDHNLNINTIGRGNVTGVGLVIYSEDFSKVLLQKEFRLAANQWLYTFPAGIIDPGETAAVAAKRELKEETGIDLIKMIDVLPPCFTCQGFSDEMMTIAIGIGSGEIKGSTNPVEEIIPRWYTKEEVRELFNNKVAMSVRTQMFLWQWLNR